MITRFFSQKPLHRNQVLSKSLVSERLLIAGIDHVAHLEGDGTGIYSGKTVTEELNVFAGLVDGKPTSWVEGTGSIR